MLASIIETKLIINYTKKSIENYLQNTYNIVDVSIVCMGIIPVIETVVEEKAKIEEPVDAFAEAMNPPEEVPQNVVTVPDGFKEMEEVEESPFTNTYYDSEDISKEEIQEPTEEVSEYNEEEMFEKFLKLSFLTRQNLLIKDFALLPAEHRGERHKVAYPIAVKVAKEKGILKDFYEAINKNSK